MRLAIRHTTRYVFTHPVVHALQRLRLRPKNTQGQHVLDWTMEYAHARCELEYEDQHHNAVTLIAVDGGATEVTVTCRGTVQTADTAGIIGRHAGHLPLWSFVGNTPLTRAGPRLRALVRSLDFADRPRLDFLHALSSAVHDAVAYGTGATGVGTTAEEAMEAGTGVCQDHAHIFIGGARLLATVREALAQWPDVWVVVDGSTDGSEAGVVELARTEPRLISCSHACSQAASSSALSCLRASRVRSKANIRV